MIPTSGNDGGKGDSDGNGGGLCVSPLLLLRRSLKIILIKNTSTTTNNNNNATTTAVCLPWTNSFFCIFMFCVSTSMSSLKGMVESSILSKDEPLTPNIDKVVGV